MICGRTGQSTTAHDKPSMTSNVSGKGLFHCSQLTIKPQGGFKHPQECSLHKRLNHKQKGRMKQK
jgi:hypothetical protein